MPSQRILEAKQKVVADLVSDYKQAKSFVFTDARGLTVLQDTQMRADLRKNNVTYKIVKNTTAKLVFDELGVKGLDEFFKGPTAIAYSTEDLIAPAKIIKEYADKYSKLDIKGGIIEGAAATAEQVNTLAKIPAKEVLCGQIAYGLLFPFTKLAMLLKAAAEKLQEEGGVVISEKTEEASQEVPEVKTEETTEEVAVQASEEVVEPTAEAAE
ncbi:MAG: 50S ribosomal protein L10 [Clostridiaceae bacterium]|nr:50S ribosomal protein L10 [Clostridiaceae bacterium]